MHDVITAPKVLIIDDDPADVAIVQDILRDIYGSGYGLASAHSWESGTEALLNAEYELCLVDYYLGGKTGLDMIGNLTQQGIRPEFILLTGNDDMEVDLAATEAGASDYLVKDNLNARVLERSIRYSLELARRRRRIEAQLGEVEAARALAKRQGTESARLAEELDAMRSDLEDAVARAEQNERKYRELAERDVLTGVANRALYTDSLIKAIHNTDRSGVGMALAMLDLDGFKEVNDTHGHAAGDMVIKTVAERLLVLVRETDTVARLGGDEFAVVAPNVADLELANGFARRLMKVFEDPVEWEGEHLKVGASIGIYYHASGVAEVDHLTRQADAAMYRAKMAGKNRFEVCSL